MALPSRTNDEVLAAKKVVDEASATPSEKAEMLMELAMGLQARPKAVDDLMAAIQLYNMALDQTPDQEQLLLARIAARRATALMAVPEGGFDYLTNAREGLEDALIILHQQGQATEVAEAEMNLGLILQSLAGAGQATVQDAINAYQRALQVFDKKNYPKEFAILQNNLATAFLSIPATDDSGKLREALAVQAFEDGLSVVTLIDHPSEYAMLQNNLGNALQYASSSHALENQIRALEAYDEALKVRTAQTTPAEYANTIANKANCLANLPEYQSEALALYREALGLFGQLGEQDKAQALHEAISILEQEIANGSP